MGCLAGVQLQFWLQQAPLACAPVVSATSPQGPLHALRPTICTHPPCLPEPKGLLSKARQGTPVDLFRTASGAVSWARMSKTGAPMARLSDSSVYLLHEGLRCWLRVASPASPASAFSSLLDSASGEPVPSAYLHTF